MIVAIMTTALSGTAWAQTTTVLLSEDFSSITAGNSTSTSGSSSSWSGNDNFSVTKYAYQAGGAVRLGSSSNTGIIVTKNSLSVSAGTLTVAFDVKGWTTVEGNIKVTAGTQNQTVTYTKKMSEGFESKSVTFNITENSSMTVQIETTAKRAFLDNIVITNTAGAPQAVATPTFSPEAGTYTSAQSVTISTETTGATIYYTTNGDDPTTSSSVYSTPISVSSTTTVKAIAAKSGMTTSDVASATYTIVTLEHAGTETDPYTVADARAAIDAGVGTTGVYATGIVSKIVTAYNSTYGNITYNISADGSTTGDQLEAYRGFSYNGDWFTSSNDIQVGDEVVIYGNLTKYNSTYEFAEGNQLVSLVRPLVPSIELAATISATPTGSVDYLPISYSNLEINAASDFSIQFYDAEGNAIATPNWIDVEVQAVEEGYSVYYAISVNTDATRTAYFKVYSGTTYSNLVTITQTASTIATLPFSFDDGKADIESKAGLTQEGLGDNYGSSPKLKFDSTDDYVLLVFNARPGVLTFDIKGNSFSGGTFKVQASSDGETFTDVATYTTLGDTETKTISNLAANVRYIKWVYTEKVSGNVALGNINLAQYVVLSDYTLTIDDPTNVTITANYGEEVLSNGDDAEVTQGTEVTLAINPASGYDIETVTITGAEEGQTVTPTATSTEGVYTFSMPAYDVTVSATVVEHVEPVTASYVLATSITSGKRYVIASGTEGSVQVMAEDRGNNRGAVAATVTDGVLSVSDEYEFVIENATIGEAVGYSIYDGTGYLYAASSSSNYLKTKTDLDENGVWSISIGSDGVATVVAHGTYTRNTMRFNSANNPPIFSCYASGQQDVYLYEKVETTPTSQTVTVSAAGYATMVANADLEIPAGVEVYAVTINSGATSAHLELVEDGIPTGEAVLVKASEGDYEFTHASVSVSKITNNDLKAATVAFNPSKANTIYCLAKKGNPAAVGFYPVATTVTIPVGKAYLEVTSGEAPVKGFYGFDDDDATGINEELRMKNEESSIYNLAGQRISKMQKGINIVNGKKILK